LNLAPESSSFDIVRWRYSEGEFMRKFLLLLITVATAVRAGSLSSTTCTLDAVTLSDPSHCFIPVIVGDTQVGLVQADATLTQTISSTSASLQAFTDAAALGVPSGSTSNAAASASNNTSFATAGSPRSGLLQFDVLLGYLHEDIAGSAAVRISDGVHDYEFIGGGGINGPVPPSHCGIEDCEYIGTLPFDLGAAFQVSIAAKSGPITVCSEGCPNGDSSVTFSLLESDGSTAVRLLATPEPAAGALLIFGLGIVVLASASRGLPAFLR
jgi:hypothetical protein